MLSIKKLIETQTTINNKTLGKKNHEIEAISKVNIYVQTKT